MPIVASPANDLHLVPSIPAEDNRAVRAAIANIWHTRVGPYSSGEGPRPMNSPAKAPIRVLVVDDEPHLVLTVRMHQPLQGYTVFGAHSREEALEAARQKLADVVILDVTKPGLDGFGKLEELRRVSNIPVIILTDPGDEEQMVRGLSLGADDCLTKPFTQRQLWARLTPRLRCPSSSSGQQRPRLPRRGRSLKVAEYEAEALRRGSS